MRDGVIFNCVPAEIVVLKAKHSAIHQANAALPLATLERVFEGSQ